jgi:hypothetical protein
MIRDPFALSLTRHLEEARDGPGTVHPTTGGFDITILAVGVGRHRHRTPSDHIQYLYVNNVAYRFIV